MNYMILQQLLRNLATRISYLIQQELTSKRPFANTVQVRRAALKNQDRTFGYPSIVNLVKLAKGDKHLQAALASMFTMKYGSIIVMEQMTYAEALPLFGLRQNVFTDPQKPMKVEPGILSSERSRREFSRCNNSRLCSYIFRSIWRAGAFRCSA